MSTHTNQPWPPDGGDGESSGAQAKAQEKAQEVAGQAQEKAQEVAGQAQEKAQAAASQAQAKLREQLDQRSSQLAQQINEQASDLRSVSDTLREQGKDGPATAAERLAEYAEKVGGYLRDKDSDGLLQDAEEFARRKPAVVAGGGLLLGFVASRFLKASSARRYSARSSAPPSRPRPAVPSRTGAGDPLASRSDAPSAPPHTRDVPPVTSGI